VVPRARGGSAPSAGVAPSGFIISFNGRTRSSPHDSFDALAGRRAPTRHVLWRSDKPINLLHRRGTRGHDGAFQRVLGQGRDSYDVRGRVAHEEVFNATTAIPLLGLATGIFALHDLTRGAAWSDLRIREQLRVPRHG